MVAQLIACQKLFVAGFNVHFAVIHRKVKLTFNFQSEIEK